MQIGFHGAARTVTGSKYLLTLDHYRLLVDCGLFQGGFEMHQRNWKGLPFDASSVDDVLFTHAHIDHTGYFPRLAADGFSGRAFATPPTKALLGVLLPDSGGLQEEEARWANKKGYSRHQPARPLYTEEDANRSLALLHKLEFERETPLHEHLKVTLHRAGHILGAAFAEIRYRDRHDSWKTVVFSGDMGRRGVPILQDPAPLPACDVLVCESTYGDRLHEATDPKEQLRRELEEAFRRGGVTVIPAFAVGRTQEILYHLFELFEEKRLPKVPVFVDSPMANSVVELYCRYESEHDVEMNALEEASGSPLRTPYFTVVRKREDSKKLNAHPGPAVVISASGMATGGRVLHHLYHRLPDARNTVLFVGYQAEGSLGRRLLEGETDVVVMGDGLTVKAAIRKIPALSAHADADELIAWMKTAPAPPKTLFLTHGEPAAQDTFAARIRSELGWNVRVPEPDDVAEV
ncbi:MAG: MBL fold metallo-hydrolase RNA specificity domain-containing protein [Thermoanaerobaculia bacterium]